MVFENFERGLPPLKRKKPSKKAQERHDLILKKLSQSNRWWNYWKFQLHWNKLEWVDPKSTPKRFNPFQFPRKRYILVKMIDQLILLVILN